MYTNITK